MSVASPTLPPLRSTSPKKPLIFNIQNDSLEVDLRRQILAGMTKTPLSLPSLLLWNDAGLKLFEELTRTPSYYPTHNEVEILRENADQMVGHIPEDSLLIELGCGSLCKTSIILSAFERRQRRISYYALDVSKGELIDGLDQLSPLFDDSPYVQVQGLWGSYEDGISWLIETTSSTSPKTVTFLWMGNSIANLQQCEAAALLKGFLDSCTTLQITCQFIISIDNCQKESRVLDAYDTTRDPFQSFVLNGLKNANEILGETVFAPEDWSCSRAFRAEDRTLDIHYTALRDVECYYAGQSWKVRQGDVVLAARSGKWSKEDMIDMCRGVGLQVANIWQHANKDYAFFAIRR